MNRDACLANVFRPGCQVQKLVVIEFVQLPVEVINLALVAAAALA
jgi:hypothetical protein